jgi:Transposase DDE domain
MTKSYLAGACTGRSDGLSWLCCIGDAPDFVEVGEAGISVDDAMRCQTECIFGWGKQHGTMRKTKHRGIARVAADFLLNLIAYNLIRIPKLLAA